MGILEPKGDFRVLCDKLRKYEKDPLERRSFMYLDFVSWLESRIREVPVQDVIRERHLASRKSAVNR